MIQIAVIAMMCACIGAAGLLAFSAVATSSKRRIDQRLAQVTATPGGSFHVVDLNDSPQVRASGALKKMCGALGHRLTPAGSVDKMRRQLNTLGNPPAWPLERVIAAKGAGVFIGAAAGFVFGLILPNTMLLLVATAAGALAGVFAPNMALANNVEKRKKAIQSELPDTIDTLTVAVEAGLGLEAALVRIGKNGRGPLAQEVRRALQENAMGSSITDALVAMGQRSGVEDLQRFVAALAQAKARGVSVGQTLRVQATEMRVKRTQTVEERAQKLQVKILVPLIFCILPTLFIVVMGAAIIQMIGAFSK